MSIILKPVIRIITDYYSSFDFVALVASQKVEKQAIIITLTGIVAHFMGKNEEFGWLKCILAR